MRRLSILAAAVAACLLFTACHNKPTDEPVTIPDGLYEETAYYQLHDAYYYPDNDTTYRTWDTVYRTTVAIVGGDFIYPDLCRDTVSPGDHLLPTIFGDHFIWLSDWYCRDKRIPARTNGDGYVYLDSIQLHADLSPCVRKYINNLRAKIVLNEDCYTWSYLYHSAGNPYTTRTISISDTLRLL